MCNVLRAMAKPVNFPFDHRQGVFGRIPKFIPASHATPWPYYKIPTSCWCFVSAWLRYTNLDSDLGSVVKPSSLSNALHEVAVSIGIYPIMFFAVKLTPGEHVASEVVERVLYHTIDLIHTIH